MSVVYLFDWDKRHIFKVDDCGGGIITPVIDCNSPGFWFNNESDCFNHDILIYAEHHFSSESYLYI